MAREVGVDEGVVTANVNLQVRFVERGSSMGARGSERARWHESLCMWALDLAQNAMFGVGTDWLAQGDPGGDLGCGDGTGRRTHGERGSGLVAEAGSWPPKREVSRGVGLPG